MKKFIQIIAVALTIIVATICSYHAGTMHVINDCHVNLYETDEGLLVAIELDDVEYLHFEEE